MITTLPGSAVPKSARITARQLVEGGGRPELPEATLVVSGGRGIGSAESFDVVEKLADGDLSTSLSSTLEEVGKPKAERSRAKSTAHHGSARRSPPSSCESERRRRGHVPCERVAAAYRSFQTLRSQ